MCEAIRQAALPLLSVLPYHTWEEGGDRKWCLSFPHHFSSLKARTALGKNQRGQGRMGMGVALVTRGGYPGSSPHLLRHM